jgi:cytochrome c-type biogenesis protein CcmH/NrfF/uncharacterized protein HemY
LTVRRVLVLVVAAGLLAAAMIAGWRSVHHPVDPGAELAAQLRCPSCQGESVAASRSPMAAAMREVIASQLAAGRTPEQIRAWFAERYGAAVLDRPVNRGAGLLLWLIPAMTAAAAILLAARTGRRRRRPPSSRAGPHVPPPGTPQAGRIPARRRWDVGAACLVALVAVIAVSGPRAADRSTGGTDRAPADPVAIQLTLARNLEQEGNFAAAAEAYRRAANQRPDGQIRLRQAFALIRAGHPAEAAPIAEQVLAAAPADPDALLVLGLAQRAKGSADATGTLRRFLQVAPTHPAAAEIGRMLASS